MAEYSQEDLTQLLIYARARLRYARNHILVFENEVEINVMTINSIKAQAYKQGLDLSGADAEEPELILPYGMQTDQIRS